MTLTVRLDGPLDIALTRYCREVGVSKSLVVQESLAAYLLNASPAVARTAAAARSVSDNHRAFADAGLIGAVADGRGADKAAVRARVSARVPARVPARAATRQKALGPKAPRQP